MTPRRPPRLAVALLNRFIGDNEPLVGDLLEEFQTRRSSLWLWRQVLVAVSIALFRRPQIRPLRLVDGAPAAIDGMRESPRHAAVNMSASPRGIGVGGLGLVALAAIVTVAAPAVWWVVLGTMVAGALLGLIMIALSRRSAFNRAGNPTDVLFADAERSTRSRGDG
jgi:hypothetical protein